MRYRSVCMLESERLLVRPFIPADTRTIYQLIYADTEIRTSWSSFSGSQKEFEARFRTGRNWSINDGFGYWALVRKADNQLVGLMGFRNHADEPTDWLVMPDGSRDVGRIPGRIDAELTYALGRLYWQNGYATEAGHALLDFGFKQMAIDRVINAIDPANVRSRHLMTRLGFSFLDNGNPKMLLGLLENPARSRRI
jgi:RimJ/RimL family protein N-acetyltransferase